MSEVFQVGQRVVVLSSAKYKDRCVGKSGEVYGIYGESVAVALDGLRNKNSGYGVFYFTAAELAPEDITEIKENGKMQKMTNFVNVAVVQFLDEKVSFRTFEYANYDPLIEVGDICVVKSAHHGMGLAEVMEIKQSPAEDLFREIVSRVDLTDFETRVAQREKAAELKAKMQERAKQLQDLVLYQTLAKEDPAMQELLTEFKALWAQLTN